MTGYEFRVCLKSIIDLLFKHNIKYMFYIRCISEGRFKYLHPIIKVRLHYIGKKYGIEIKPNTIIGKGFRMVHPYNITINPNAIIGDNVNVYKGVTIGEQTRGKRKGNPIIGNKVQIGINSTIVGGIHIGNNVLIAPNCFVNEDIPDNSIVIGNPCKIINNIKATQSYVFNCE